MGDYENFINEAVDDDKEATFSNVDKMQAFMVEQGTKTAFYKMQVIAYDDITTAGSVYFQYADGSIKKWGANNIRYSAPLGTLWADRSTATYTAETV